MEYKKNGPTRVAFASDYGDPILAAKRAALGRHLPKRSSGPPLSPSEQARLERLTYASQHYGETGEEIA